MGKEASAGVGDASAEVRAGAIQGGAGFTGRQVTWAMAGASGDRCAAPDGVGERTTASWRSRGGGNRLTLLPGRHPCQA